MKVMRRIESFFAEVVFPALKFLCRFVLLAILGILVLAALWVCFKIGTDYGPATTELVEQQVADRWTKFAQGSVLAGFGGLLALVELRAWWEGLEGNLSKFLSSGGVFLKRGASCASLGGCMLSLWKCGRALVVPAVLSGSVASVANPPPPPIVERVLVPVLHQVHFENAAFEEGRLSDRGVTLGSAREAVVERILDELKQCADREDPEKSPVKIKPYGFASDDEFRGSGPRENETRNLQAANARARAVYDKLQQLRNSLEDSRWIKLEGPQRWHVPKEWDDSDQSPEMQAMRKERDSLIPVVGDDRDPFADRAVVLKLTNPGKCEVGPVETKEDN